MRIRVKNAREEFIKSVHGATDTTEPLLNQYSPVLRARSSIAGKDATSYATALTQGPIPLTYCIMHESPIGTCILNLGAMKNKFVKHKKFR